MLNDSHIFNWWKQLWVWRSADRHLNSFVSSQFYEAKSNIGWIKKKLLNAQHSVDNQHLAPLQDTSWENSQMAPNTLE